MKLSRRLLPGSSALARWKTFNARNKLSSLPIELRLWIGELPNAQSLFQTTEGTVTPESRPTPVSWPAFDT